MLIYRASSSHDAPLLLNDRPKHAILLGGLLNRAMFSHSCPSRVRGSSGRPPQRKRSTRGHILRFTIWGLVSVNGGCQHQKPTLAHVPQFLSWGAVWVVGVVDQKKGDDVLISWRSVSPAVWFGSNVYIWTVGTNRACGSFTMQGRCGWPNHSASWRSLNIVCQTQHGLCK